jgi:hypothetical protein
MRWERLGRPSLIRIAVYRNGLWHMLQPVSPLEFAEAVALHTCPKAGIYTRYAGATYFYPKLPPNTPRGYWYE